MTAAAFNSDRVIVVRRIPRFIFPQLKKRKSKVLLSKRFDSVLSNRRLKRPIKLTGDTYMKNDGISNICLVYGYYYVSITVPPKFWFYLIFWYRLSIFTMIFLFSSVYAGTIKNYFFTNFQRILHYFWACTERSGEISVLAMGCYRSDREFDGNNHQFTIYWNR